MSGTRNVIGPRLREHRKKQGLTQTMLAAKCGVIGWDITSNAIAKIELGFRQVLDSEVAILAKAMKIDPGQLYPME